MVDVGNFRIFWDHAIGVFNIRVMVKDPCFPNFRGYLPTHGGEKAYDDPSSLRPLTNILNTTKAARRSKLVG